MTLMVEPRQVLEGGVLGIVDTAPWPALPDQGGPAATGERFGHTAMTPVVARSHRGHSHGQRQPLRVASRKGRHAATRVMGQGAEIIASADADHHLEAIEREICVQHAGCLPPQQVARADIDPGGHERPARGVVTSGSSANQRRLGAMVWHSRLTRSCGRCAAPSGRTGLPRPTRGGSTRAPAVPRCSGPPEPLAAELGPNRVLKKGSCDSCVGQERPGSGGQQPPRLSIARPISASGERNPKAMRVSRRSFVLTDSTRALESSWVSAASVLAR